MKRDQVITAGVVGLAVTLVGLTVTVFTWLDGRYQSKGDWANVDQVTKNETHLDDLRDRTRALEADVGLVRSDTDHTRESLDRLEKKIDKLYDLILSRLPSTTPAPGPTQQKPPKPPKPPQQPEREPIERQIDRIERKIDEINRRLSPPQPQGKVDPWTSHFTRV